MIGSLLDKEPRDLKIRDLAAAAHQGTANILASMGRNHEAETEIRAAIALADGTLALSPETLEAQGRSLDAHYALEMLRRDAHPAEIEMDARKQLPLAIKLAKAHPDDAGVQDTLSEYYAMLGSTMNRQNRLEESLVYYRKAAEVREASYRKNPHNTKFQRSLMIGYGHIGDTLGNPFTGCLGDYRGALDYYDKAARIAEDMSSADPSDKRAVFDLGMIWTRIGASRQAAGDPKGSNQALDRAIAQFEPLVQASPDNASDARGLAIAYEYRGRNQWLLGDRSSAMIWYRKSLAIADKVIAIHPTDVGGRSQRVAANGPISVLLAMEGDRANAARIAQETVSEAHDNLSSGGTLVSEARAWFWYGQTYETLRDDQTAAAGYEKAVEAWKRTGPALTGAFVVGDAGRPEESRALPGEVWAAVVLQPS